MTYRLLRIVFPAGASFALSVLPDILSSTAEIAFCALAIPAR